MALVTLSATTFDLNGFVVLDAIHQSTLRDISRRVNRAQTLDGGVAINDFGMSEGDRSFTIKWVPLSREFEDQVARLLRMHSRVHVSTEDGCYLAAPEGYRYTPKESSLTLLCIERLSEI